MAKNKDDRFLNNNEELPIKVEYDYSMDEINEIKKCKEDIFYFAEKYFYIVNLDVGRQKIKLFDAQRRAISTIIDNRYTIVCASRQCGKSTLMTVVCLWYTMFMPDYTVAVLANKEDIAKELLDRIKMAYTQLPLWLKAGVWIFSQELVKLTNGSKIMVSTTSVDAIRGKSVNLLFLDEFAHVRKEVADEFFKSVIPTISSSKTSKMIIVSTPNGMGNRYYDIYSSAERKKLLKGAKTAWAPVRIHYSEIPGRDAAWKEDQLELIQYDMTLWNQEYEIMFLEDGTSAINTELIEKMKSLCLRPEFLFDGNDYSIWKEPERDHIYVIGVDAAEGVGKDNSVSQILDITNLQEIEQVGIFVSNKMQPYVYAEKLNQIVRSWGRPFLCVERNAQGGQVLDAMFNVHKYDNIVDYSMKNDKRQAYQNMGIFCHQNSKYTGIMNMKYFVEHLEAVKLYDMQTVKEFETFIRRDNKTWGAKKGFNDDRIMSLIWALILLETELAEKYLEVLDYDDAGKPMKIRDPNIDLANELRETKEQVSYYSRTGGMPMPTMFHRGGHVLDLRSREVDQYTTSGWKIV